MAGPEPARRAMVGPDQSGFNQPNHDRGTAGAPREVHIVMTDHDESQVEGAEAQENAEEEILEPQSKYERIMLAAAEATRLNEEIRRKGIDIKGKVTSEALKRVDEGKVKGVLRPKTAAFETPVPGETPPSSDMLFGLQAPGLEPPAPAKDDGETPAPSEKE